MSERRNVDMGGLGYIALAALIILFFIEKHSADIAQNTDRIATALEAQVERMEADGE